MGIIPLDDLVNQGSAKVRADSVIFYQQFSFVALWNPKQNSDDAVTSAIPLVLSWRPVSRERHPKRNRGFLRPDD